LKELEADEYEVKLRACLTAIANDKVNEEMLDLIRDMGFLPKKFQIKQTKRMRLKKSQRQQLAAQASLQAKQQNTEAEK